MPKWIEQFRRDGNNRRDVDDGAVAALAHRQDR